MPFHAPPAPALAPSGGPAPAPGGRAAGTRPQTRAAPIAPTLLADLVGLVLPVSCAGCGAADVPWCGDCGALLAARPWRCEERAARLDRLDDRPMPMWTLAECVGATRHAVVAWKDRGRLDLTAPFAAALREAGRAVAFGSGPVARGSPPLLVVAAPSSGAARRRRGGNLADALGRGVAAGLTTGGVPAVSADALRRRAGADQVGLGARGRARNLLGRVHVRAAAAERVRGRAVVLVDDVLTTGATFAACRRALEAEGATVVAGFTLASTPPPGAVTA